VKLNSFWTYGNKNVFGEPLRAVRLILPWVFLFGTANLLRASERLPLTVHSAADGLASSVIHHIARDSQGFLWFCARGGLSRYDGYEFTSYRFGDDQASVLVHFFLETRDGTFWIAADNGLYRVKPQEKTEVRPSGEIFRKGERRLSAVKVADQTFFSLYEDRRGRLWGGIYGLF
jgi:ligand-binding sensor domain-containing protein